MFRQRHPRTISQHLPTAYDGRGLGRDDPVWPRYVKEASKWDEDLIDGWNKGMDVILLFAALFSAIVTAFLIESYQTLKPDNEEIAAAGVIIMVDLLQAIATGQSPNTSSITSPSPSDFQPTTSAVLINVMWFLSLTLSVTVALLAMLVKQWGEGYRLGHGLAPPSVQARTRQARYDKLKKWRTEDIVMALPVLMHAALGLFMLGLILFLKDLSRIVLAPVMVVVMTMLVLYLATTFLPLVVAFCPYNTPLSSRRLWESFCQVFGFTDTLGRSWFVAQCQQEEKDRSESTTPDDLTTRALEWLIRHSQDNRSVDFAIRAISSTVLEAGVWKLLAQDSLITLVAQKFTALFNGALDQGSAGLSPGISNRRQLVQASFYARALGNIVKHVQLQRAPGNGGSDYTAQQSMTPQAGAILNEDQVIAVERGLSLLASNQHDIVAASGITSVSTWYTSTSRESQSREKWKTALIRLIAILLSSNVAPKDGNSIPANDDVPTTNASAKEHTHDENVIDDDDAYQANDILKLTKGILDTDTLTGLVLTLPIELSHWRWDLSKQEKVEILEPMMQLLDSYLLEGPTRSGISVTLAVLALLVEDHIDIPFNESSVLRSEDDELYKVSKIYNEWEEKYNPGSYDEDFFIPMQQVVAPKTEQRSRRAQWTAYLCTTEPTYLRKHSDALLVLGLAGLLDSLEELGLADSTADSGLAARVSKIIAAQLRRMHIINQTEPITLPYIFPATYDIRVYLMDVITRALDPSPFEGRSDPLPADAKADLLQCLSEKKHLWFDFGSQLLMPIAKLLHSDDNRELQTLCLATLDEYCLTNSAFDPEVNLRSSFYHHPIDWKFFFALDVPHRLVKIIHENTTLRSRAISSMYSLISILPNQERDPEISRHVAVTVRQLASDGLLDTLATEVVCRSGHQHSALWREQIINIPDTLDPDWGDYAQIVGYLRQFCENYIRESGHLNTVALGLKNKLEALETDSER